MRPHAWIDFEWRGKRYHYTGEIPPELQEAFGDAHIRLGTRGEEETVAAILAEAGAIILEVHSIRPDGSIHGSDLPDLKIP